MVGDLLCESWNDLTIWYGLIFHMFGPGRRSPSTTLCEKRKRVRFSSFFSTPASTSRPVKRFEEPIARSASYDRSVVQAPLASR